ncbi:thiamine phosphate synthase [soil metagenome]
MHERIRLYVVLDPSACVLPPVEVAHAVLSGGATALQLRMKSQSDRAILDLAVKLREIVKTYGGTFIVNDRIDLALASKADGVHLGVDDLPLGAAAEIGGPSFILGYSPETDGEAARAKLHGASYLGVGPVFGTSSKLDAGPALGLNLFAQRVSICDLPVAGIGGITAANARSIVDAGASGVAVMSSVLRTTDPAAATRAIAAALR